ncbi:MAG TPA: hypothetical protein VFO79_11390, partial [Xanthomonadales bacterium]|nr:hypothetical protein [Xanthomonadales bacterium]
MHAVVHGGSDVHAEVERRNARSSRRDGSAVERGAVPRTDIDAADFAGQRGAQHTSRGRHLPRYAAVVLDAMQRGPRLDEDRAIAGRPQGDGGNVRRQEVRR